MPTPWSRPLDRASALTRHLAAFSRRQVLQPRVVNVNQVVTDLMGLVVPLVGSGSPATSA